MTPIARIGDSISHGGSINSGSPNWKCNGIPIARVTDTAICDIHGLVTIVTGSPPPRTCDNLPIARIGSLCSCGATIVSGSPNWKVT